MDCLAAKGRRVKLLLAAKVKEAAESDLRGLAEEAGFRPASDKSKRRYHCKFHPDKNASGYLYANALQLFCCDERFDSIDLARIIIGGSPGDAIQWLAAKYGIVQDCGNRPQARFSEADFANAELFRTGLSWALENELAALKRPLVESGLIDGEQIFNLTTLLTQAKSWSPWRATVFYTKLRRRDPERVKRWIEDAHQSQLQLAGIIAALGDGSIAA
jgi:hypothetical protein